MTKDAVTGGRQSGHHPIPRHQGPCFSFPLAVEKAMNVQKHAAFRDPKSNKHKHKHNKGNGKHHDGAKSDAGEPKEKMGRKEYEKELYKLQVELCHLQDWVRETKARVIIVCEGRDTAGKGGLIRRLTERVSPRTFRIVALSAQSQYERKKMFFQRYVEQFPVEGEVVVFDRSWYNRAGVERVMGFTPEDEIDEFLLNVPQFEKWLVSAGVILIKLWLEVGMDEQDRRFKGRIEDPLKQWKLSPMDLKSYTRWYDYSRARDAMFKTTSRDPAPWHVLHSNDKKRARLNGIKYILSLIPYKRIKHDKIELPKRGNRHHYDDHLDTSKVKLVPEFY